MFGIDAFQTEQDISFAGFVVELGEEIPEPDIVRRNVLGFENTRCAARVCLYLLICSLPGFSLASLASRVSVIFSVDTPGLPGMLLPFSTTGLHCGYFIIGLVGAQADDMNAVHRGALHGIKHGRLQKPVRHHAIQGAKFFGDSIQICLVV